MTKFDIFNCLIKHFRCTNFSLENLLCSYGDMQTSTSLNSFEGRGTLKLDNRFEGGGDHDTRFEGCGYWVHWSIIEYRFEGVGIVKTDLRGF